MVTQGSAVGHAPSRPPRDRAHNVASRMIEMVL